jgi:hypothetical protein
MHKFKVGDQVRINVEWMNFLKSKHAPFELKMSQAYYAQLADIVGVVNMIGTAHNKYYARVNWQTSLINSTGEYFERLELVDQLFFVLPNGGMNNA